MTTLWIGVVFGGLAALFLMLALTDFVRCGFPAAPARKAWFRIGLIFAAISIYLVLVFFQRLFR